MGLKREMKVTKVFLKKSGTHINCLYQKQTRLKTVNKVLPTFQREQLEDLNRRKEMNTNSEQVLLQKKSW